MAALTKQDVLDSCTELISGVPDGAWIWIIPLANRLISDRNGIEGGEDGAELRAARLLYAAHLATVVKRGKTGAAGPLTSKAVGQVRESFGLVALAATDASLGATGYGQQLLGLLQWSLAAGPRLL